jgi:predicted ATP-dependent protease
VLDRGYYSFGRPTVISAQAVPGNDGLINVEREAGLSGEIHDKGSYIVESYVHARYARDFPLSMTARIAFEQSYVEVEGDSASSSEICSLLSAIGGIELRQDIAVTGSVNQMGEIQPVGGVIEKIEGFYEVCRQQGLTGEQGVIIPIQNIESLILSDDVNQAISSGKFHIWAIRTIDEGMEILSGLPAGERDDSGAFPEGSVNARVEARLREMAEIMKESDDAADD